MGLKRSDNLPPQHRPQHPIHSPDDPCHHKEVRERKVKESTTGEDEIGEYTSCDEREDIGYYEECHTSSRDGGADITCTRTEERIEA